mmetsp:Transcript_14517/g.17602  ORF Transcript_14517/g.17602 Transcript_14517/m.17602 type:complete len:750 (+) Transcript_14517:92-2341(+)
MQPLDTHSPGLRSWNSQENAPSKELRHWSDIDGVGVQNYTAHRRNKKENSIISPNFEKKERHQQKLNVREISVTATVRFGPTSEFSVTVRKKVKKTDQNNSWRSKRQNNNTHDNITWADIKDKARQHDEVLKYFTLGAQEKLSPHDFSLVASVAGEGDMKGELLIPSGSSIEFEPAGNKDRFRKCSTDIDPSASCNWRKKCETAENEANIKVLLLYTPNIHICTYDGLNITLPTLGHWLQVHDMKSQGKIVGNSTPNSKRGRPMNDALLLEENKLIMCQFLQRLNQFCKRELRLDPDEYALCLPFGDFKSEFCALDSIHARVQFADPKVYWELLLNFDLLLTSADNRKIEYVVHQRETWSTLRFNDYRRWAVMDRKIVKQEHDLSMSQASVVNPRMEIREMFFFDENRMQIHWAIPESLDSMQGAMGSVSTKLRKLVDEYQTLSSTLETKDFHLIIHGQNTHFSLSPRKYVQILRASGEDSISWCNKVLERLTIDPERFYSGLLAEGAGLAQCIPEILETLDTEPAAPLSADVLNSLRERNRVSERLKVVGNRMKSDPPTSTFGFRGSAKHKYPLSKSLSPQSLPYKNSAFNYSQNRDAVHSRRFIYDHSPRSERQEYVIELEDPSERLTQSRIRYAGINADPFRKSIDAGLTVPGPGYICRVCGQPGGQLGSHWYQQCTMNEAKLEMNRGDIIIKRSPGLGYTCKLCGQKGGVPGSHWVQYCPFAKSGSDKRPGSLYEFWEARQNLAT